MNAWAKRCCLLLVIAALLGSAAARAEDEGQPLLDQAIEKKLGASNINELGEVIDLAQQALDKGLSEDNADFAKRLLTSSLLQRATAIVQSLLRGIQQDARWLEQLPKLRELAMADLERILKIDPKQHEALFLVGRLHALPGGDRERGLEALGEAAELAEDPVEKARILTTRSALQESPEDQLADLDAALALDPTQTDGLERRGRLRLELGQAAEALADLEAALKEEPNNAVTLEAKGIALLQLARIDEALVVFDRVLEIEPRMFATYLHRARVFMARGDWANAIDELDKSLLINAGNPAAYLLRANCHQRLGQLDKAKRDIDKLLELQPGSVAGLRLRAGLLAGGGEIEEAIKILEELHGAAPDDFEISLQLAVLYRAEGRVRDSIVVLDEVIAAQPELGLALRHRGDALLSIGRQKEAIADYEAALKDEGSNATLLNNMAWVLATSPDDSLRDGSRSIELATKACELTEYKAAFILSTLAAAHAESGNFDEALKWIKQADELAEEALKGEIAKEQASYEAKKPWRELQEVEDKSTGVAAESESSDETKPAEDKPKDDAPKEAPAEGDKPAEDKPADEQPKSDEPAGEKPAESPDDEPVTSDALKR